jgi:large subunit ribosomal protein L9
LGITVDKKTITIPDSIKTIGEYKVAIKTGYQTTAHILVQVVPETIGDTK